MTHHGWHFVKHILLDTIWDKINLMNVSVIFCSAWAQLAIFATISINGVVWWVQSGIGVLSITFLCAYNALKFYRLWRDEEKKEKENKK